MSGKKYHVLLEDCLRHAFKAEDDMQALVTAFILGYEDTKVYLDDKHVGTTPRFVCKSEWVGEYLDKMRRELP